MAEPALAQGDGFVEVEGLSVHYARWDGPRKTKAPGLLLLHGLGGSTIHWELAGPALARRFRVPVTAIDLPGFGLTRAPATAATLPIACAVVTRLLERAGPAWVIGNSMGASVAVSVAAEHPDLVARLTLVTPALPQNALDEGFHPILPHNWPAAIPGLGAMAVSAYAASTSDEQVVDDRLGRSFFDLGQVDPDIRARMIALVHERRDFAEAPAAYAAATRSLFWYVGDPAGMQADIQRTTAPTQIIHGEDDRLIPLALAQAAVRRRPDWLLTVLPDCGHMPQLEAPDRFLAAVHP